MAVVSTLHSPSLEKSNSEFLGSNSPTPSPTSYKPHPSEVASPKPRQRPAFLPLNESAETLSQQSPPPSALIQPSRSQKQVGELEAGRPRGQSASSRPTLRLHIANPTDPPPVQPSYVQEQAVRSTLEALQARAQTIPSLYPSSVAAANSTGSTSPSRRRGETFSDFSNPSSGGISGLIAHTSHQIGSRSASPLPIRITTANLNYAASAVNTAPNSSSTSNSSGSGSASSTTRSNPISNKRPYRASPLVGPQAMATQSSATGTASSVSTAPTFVFSDDYYSSSVSTPATQESASSDFSHFTSPRVPAGPRNRPLPVPPPPTMGTPISTLSTISTIPTKTVSPLSAPAPPSLPPHPALSNHAALGYGHSRSSSTDLNLNDPINAELAYRLEKRRGKQPIRGDTAPSSPTEDEVPYELRSEKWKGKQRMRDSTYDALNSSPHEQFVSPVITNANAALPQRNDTNSFRSSDDRELGLPPSLSGTLSNRPSRASIASSHSSTRSGAGGISEGGVSKWKGKGKEVLKTMSISSISSLEKESAGSIAKFGKGRGVRKSGSVSSFTNPNSLRSDSPVSFSNSPAMSPAAPSIPSPFIAPAPRHPPVLMPGHQSNSISRMAAGSPRITSPRLPADLGSLSRTASPRPVAWSPTPPMPMYVEPPLPLNVRRVVTSPVISSAPKLPPKDDKYLPHNAPRQPRVVDDIPMHTHPFEADNSDDSDEEGRRLFKEVEAAYVSPSVPDTSASSTDRAIDIGYGYAEPGYEDDERVYVDDGYDDGELDILDEEYGFGVSASGQLVGGGAPSASVSALGHTSIGHSGISSSRVSLARERRSPSPMRYARRRRNSLFEDDEDYSTGPDSNGMQSPVGPGDLPSPNLPQLNPRSKSPALEGFVYVERTALPSPSPLANASTATVQPIPVPDPQLLSPKSPLSPYSSSSSSPSPSDPTKPRGRHRNRNDPNFDPAEILGEELEMAFSKNPSPTRHPTKGVVGTSAPLMEDMVYVRGKWRMRSPSPGMSPISPADAGGAGSRGKAAGGGLRKYASEESLLSAGIPPEMNYRGGRTENDHSGGTGFAPLRSSRFDEFNLAPNPQIAMTRFVDRAPTPDSLDSGSRVDLGFTPNQSRKSLSSSKSASSGRQTPSLRGSGSKPAYADDYGLGGGWKAAAEVAREGKPPRRPRAAQEKGPEQRERGRDDRAPSKLEKRKPVQRGLSLPRASGGGGSSGSDREIKRAGTTAASHHRHTQQPSSEEHISYDLWIQRGMDRKSAAVKGRKSKI